MNNHKQPLSPSLLNQLFGMVCFLLPFGIFAACSSPTEIPYQLSFSLDSSFDAGLSGQSNLASANSGIVMNWIERRQDSSFLKLSFRDTQSHNWSAAQTVQKGTEWFINFADFPALTTSGDLLHAHFLKSSGPDYFSYDILMSVSADLGKTWSTPRMPHQDATESEHGFVSTIAWQDGFYSVWIDGRHTTGHHSGDMKLMGAKINPDGSVSEKTVLNTRVCECCQTTLARTPTGLMVAYRGRSQDEIRDIHIQHFDGTHWQEPRVAFSDNWKIPGCPVNGPVLAEKGKNVALAWYSAKDDQTKVRVIFSTDGGKTFGKPVLLNQNTSFGRIDALWLDEDHLAVSFLEYGTDHASLMVRVVSENGQVSEPFIVFSDMYFINRGSGFPRMALQNDELWITWTEWQGAFTTVRRSMAKIR